MLYQVLNESMNDAGNEKYLALFRTHKQAREHVQYLKNEIGLDEKFYIQRVRKTQEVKA